MSLIDEIAKESACYCFNNSSASKAVVYLLANIARKDHLTASQLSSAASCYCYDDATWKKVVVYLLSNINGAGVVCIVGGVGPPVGTVPCDFSAYVQQPGPNYGLWLGDLVSGWQCIITQGP